MTRFLTMFAVVALVLSLTPAAAETYRHESAGIQFELPEGWSIEKDEDGDYQIHSPDQLVYVNVYHSRKDEFAAAITHLKELVAEDATDASYGEVESLQSNGLEVRFLEGEASFDGVKKEIAAALYWAGGGRVLIVAAIGAPDDMERHREALGELVQSIKP